MVSREKAENVVKPPNMPVITNGLRWVSPRWAAATTKNPIKNDPITFTAIMDSGNSDGPMARSKATPVNQRNDAPIAPPRATRDKVEIMGGLSSEPRQESSFALCAQPDEIIHSLFQIPLKAAFDRLVKLWAFHPIREVVLP